MRSVIAGSGKSQGSAGVPAVPFGREHGLLFINHILLFLFSDNQAKVVSKEGQVSRWGGENEAVFAGGGIASGGRYVAPDHALY